MRDGIVKDNFYYARGGRARCLKLHCRCHAELCYYQKDGAGPLLRLYVDRLLASVWEVSWTINQLLDCPACGEIIGLGYVYCKENRPAYRLFQGALITKA
jgi:hypothetical protein